MDISIFEVAGPIMIGPSSSHTAGAAKLARVAGLIVGQPFRHVSFGLHGSFAKTYRGHGTDRALVAGVLGLREDDERLAHSFELAAAQGISYDFYEIQLEGVHENSVKITFTLLSAHEPPPIFTVVGSSVGGGQILISQINGFGVELTAQSPTLMIQQYDKKGVVSQLTTVLANHNINIAVMKLSRQGRGELASCIIETDGEVSGEVVTQLRQVPNVLSVQVIAAV